MTNPSQPHAGTPSEDVLMSSPEGSGHAKSPQLRQGKNEAPMVTLNVTGMACDGCAKAVERLIKAQDPRASVKVDLGAGF